MTDILFGNNNRPALKLLAKRSLKAQKNTIAVLAIMLATLLFTSLSTIAISLQTAMQESNMRTIGTSSHAAGTSRAVELGEVQGAASSLAIVVTGLLTVIVAPIFARLAA